MEDIKKSYRSLLVKLEERQKELGLTDLETANWLGIKPSNYRRLISGAYPMTVPRFEQVCAVLGYGLCLVEEGVIKEFCRCVEEDFVDLEGDAIKV